MEKCPTDVEVHDDVTMISPETVMCYSCGQTPPTDNFWTCSRFENLTGSKSICYGLGVIPSLSVDQCLSTAKDSSNNDLLTSPCLSVLRQVIDDNSNSSRYGKNATDVELHIQEVVMNTNQESFSHRSFNFVCDQYFVVITNTQYYSYLDCEL